MTCNVEVLSREVDAGATSSDDYRVLRSSDILETFTRSEVWERSEGKLIVRNVEILEDVAFGELKECKEIVGDVAILHIFEISHIEEWDLISGDIDRLKVVEILEIELFELVVREVKIDQSQ